MGPEEFPQDQLYLMERDRLHQRALHGYGTVLGLGVRVQDDPGGRPEVVVDPGLAVTPRGESVCVARAQCAGLDGWLAAHAGEIVALGSPPGSPPLGSPPAALTLWVVLCARECETDLVPVLGDPCRTAEDATAASRIADDFELRLVTDPPEHQEEAAVRLFGELLRAIEVTDAGGPFLTPADLAALVRRLVPSGSPPALPTLAEILAGSPPILVSPPGGALLVHPDDARAAFLAAWREWVAFVRPQLAGGAAGCPNGGEACVLLARLDFALATGLGGEPIVDGPVVVDDVDRPWLLHTRLLQELRWAGGAVALALGGGFPPQPFVFDLGAFAPDPAAAPAAVPRTPAVPPPRAGGLVIDGVDLNRASAGELTAIPGVGAVLARRLVSAREALGGFADLDDLRRTVTGVGDALLARLRARLQG
jgi:hypothetical protein